MQVAIYLYGARLPVLFDYTIKASDDPFDWHREVILDAWSLPAEAIKRVQQPKRTAIAKAVRHEVN